MRRAMVENIAMILTGYLGMIYSNDSERVIFTSTPTLMSFLAHRDRHIKGYPCVETPELGQTIIQLFQSSCERTSVHESAMTRVHGMDNTV
ncbi:hypothetical protein OPQ81_003967 [Rhizoctonia solani]|nr:hypothetical protein OPQ81_003967 [Rhizoctonia solani]